jgi:hypothetical protein
MIHPVETLRTIGVLALYRSCVGLQCVAQRITIMKLFLLLVVVVAVCVSLSDCRLFSNYPVVSFRGGAKGGKGSVGHAEASNGSRKGVKRGKGRSEGRRRSKAKRSKSTSFKARLEKLAKQGQFVYKDVYRRAKVQNALRTTDYDASVFLMSVLTSPLGPPLVRI